MSYVYDEVDKLQNQPKVGSKQCVALVQHYANVPHTSRWKEGEKVFGNKNIKKGTAIATFVNGKYPNKGHGNHAAFYMGQDKEGIIIMDQWTDNIKKPHISQRHIPLKGKWGNGEYAYPSDNAEAFSVIE